MTQNNDVQKYAAQIQALLENNLGLRGRDLPHLLGKSRHRLPRHVWRAASTVAEANTLAQNPKLAVTIDVTACSRTAETVMIHLRSIDPKDRRMGLILSVLGSVSFSVIAVFALLVAVLVWRGFL